MGQSPGTASAPKALTMWFSQVRILNHVTWKMITEFGHPATVNNPKIVSLEVCLRKG